MPFGQIVAVLVGVSVSGGEAPAEAPAAASAEIWAHLEVGGDLLMVNTDGVEQKVPLSVVADVAYQESYMASLSPDGSTPATSPPPASTSLRWYDRAEATIKIGPGGTKLSLPEDRRRIVASATADSAVLFRPDGPLTRDELDLLNLPAGTHVLDRLCAGPAVLAGISVVPRADDTSAGRPSGTPRVGDKWKHDATAIKLLLGLDEVTECDAESTVVAIEGEYLKLRLAGSLSGRTDGAATELEVKAGYVYHTNLRRITRLNLAFAEKREAGQIGPAVDVVGNLTLQVDPAPAQLEHDHPLALAGEPTPDQTLLELHDEATGLRLLYDRNWYVTSHERERIVLRRIEDGEFLSQCNVMMRPEHQEGRRPTLADFEGQVRFSLGDRFQAVVSGGEWTNASGLDCYRLVVHGAVDELPMEWRYYVASPDAGPSVALVFSVEPHLAERLGESDQTIVESVELAAAEPLPQPARPDVSARKGDSSRPR